MEFLDYLTRVFSPLCDEVTVTRTKENRHASSFDIIFDVTLKSGDVVAHHQFRESDLLLWQAEGTLYSKLIYEE